ncbi:MAG: DUF262 domain-containing HNH endonuclease family protein [Myxococcota bacterium]
MAKQRLLDTDTVSLKEFFSAGRQYRVPLFQRDYAWDVEQWEALWQDVVESRSAAFPHYMGAIVLQRGPKEEFLVIDGQQRLATLITACVAALDLLNERNEKERLTWLRTNYVGSPDPGSLKWQSKLVLNETDDDFFQEFVVNQKQPPPGARLVESNRRLLEARRYFRDRWQELVGPEASGQVIVDAFQETMGTQLAFTTITVDDELNAYSVFETLNARSLQLTSTDLLKNYLFSLLKGGKVDLELAQRQWRRIVETVEAQTLPSFLRQFWISQHKLVRADRLFRALKTEVTSREQSFELLDGMEAAAVDFRALGDPNDEIWVDSRECREHIRTLTLLDVSLHIPLLLACRRRGFDLARLETVLRACLVVFMRHTVVGKRNPSELEQRFAQLAVGVSDGRLPSPRAIWLGVDGRDGLRDSYVSDEDFRSDFARLDLARRGRKAKLPRYLLFSLDAKAGGAAGDYETSPETLEHVLPENPGASWAHFSEEDRRRFTNRLGNYVLLSRDENRALGAASFEDKAKVFQQSSRPTTRWAGESADWTVQAIIDRQARLADLAVSVWRFEI